MSASGLLTPGWFVLSSSMPTPDHVPMPPTPHDEQPGPSPSALPPAPALPVSLATLSVPATVVGQGHTPPPYSPLSAFISALPHTSAASSLTSTSTSTAAASSTTSALPSASILAPHHLQLTPLMAVSSPSGGTRSSPAQAFFPPDLDVPAPAPAAAAAGGAHGSAAFLPDPSRLAVPLANLTAADLQALGLTSPLLNLTPLPGATASLPFWVSSDAIAAANAAANAPMQDDVRPVKMEYLEPEQSIPLFLSSNSSSNPTAAPHPTVSTKARAPARTTASGRRVRAPARSLSLDSSATDASSGSSSSGSSRSPSSSQRPRRPSSSTKRKACDTPTRGKRRLSNEAATAAMVGAAAAERMQQLQQLDAGALPTDTPSSVTSSSAAAPEFRPNPNEDPAVLETLQTIRAIMEKVDVVKRRHRMTNADMGVLAGGCKGEHFSNMRLAALRGTFNGGNGALAFYWRLAKIVNVAPGSDAEAELDARCRRIVQERLQESQLRPAGGSSSSASGGAGAVAPAAADRAGSSKGDDKPMTMKQLKRLNRKFMRQQILPEAREALQEYWESRGHYPTDADVKRLARIDSLTEKRVLTWFQNKRTREGKRKFTPLAGGATVAAAAAAAAAGLSSPSASSSASAAAAPKPRARRASRTARPTPSAISADSKAQLLSAERAAPNTPPTPHAPFAAKVAQRSEARVRVAISAALAIPPFAGQPGTATNVDVDADETLSETLLTNLGSLDLDLVSDESSHPRPMLFHH